MTLWPPDDCLAIRIALCILFVSSKHSVWPPYSSSCSPCFLFHALSICLIFSCLFLYFNIITRDERFTAVNKGEVGATKSIQAYYWPFQGGSSDKILCQSFSGVSSFVYFISYSNFWMRISYKEHYTFTDTKSLYPLENVCWNNLKISFDAHYCLFAHFGAITCSKCTKVIIYFRLPIKVNS